jgi:hypothetical protein
MTKNAFHYLYYKYLRQQQRVGNGTVAHVTASQIMALLITFTLMDCFLIVGYFTKIPLPSHALEVWIGFVLALMGCCYWVFAANGKYRKIVTIYEHEDDHHRRNGNIYATLWPVLVYGVFFGMLLLFALSPVR